MTGRNTSRLSPRFFNYAITAIALGTPALLCIEVACSLSHEGIEVGRVLRVVLLASVKWFSLGWALFYLNISCCIRVSNNRVFGWRRKTLRRAVQRVSDDRRESSFVFFGTALSIGVGALLLLAYLVFRHPYILYPLTAVAAQLVWIWTRLSEPCAVLLLSTSRNDMNLYAHYDIKMFVSPMRVCSLLEYDHDPAGAAHESSPDRAKLYSSVRLDCFRTTFDDDWRDVLSALADQSQVIVVDALRATEHTVAEAVHLKERGYLYKTVFLTNYKGEIPVVEQAFGTLEHTKTSYCIADCTETFRILKSVFHDLALPSPERGAAGLQRTKNAEETFPFTSTTAEVRVSRGLELLRKSNFREAEANFLEALHSTCEAHESILSNLVIVSLSLGKLDEARERVANALKIKSEHPNAVYFAGIIQERLGNLSAAREHFRTFLRIAPLTDTLRIQECRKRLQLAWNGMES